MTTRARAVALCLPVTVLLAACGTTQPAETSSTPRAASATSGGSGGTTGNDTNEPSQQAVGPITVKDDLGRTVTLDQPATRVVVLEWQQVEDVVSLGVQPVGVADVEGYNTWDSAAPLPKGTTDVGKRGEPSSDAVFSTNPDLVIVEASRGDAIIRQLTGHGVPVFVSKGADAKDPVGTMKRTFSTIAEMLGKTDRAKKVLAHFDATVADARTKVDRADPATRKFAYFDAYLDGSNVSIRMFGKGSLVSGLAKEIGLQNVWKGKVDPAYGLGQTDIEGLTAVGDANVFFTGTQARPFRKALDKNAVWRNLAFVKQDRLHAFPDGIWTFGGPKSSEQIVRAFADAVAS